MQVGVVAVGELATAHDIVNRIEATPPEVVVFNIGSGVGVVDAGKVSSLGVGAKAGVFAFELDEVLSLKFGAIKGTL